MCRRLRDGRSLKNPTGDPGCSRSRSAPFGARIAMQATELGGYLIPAGTEVLVSLYHTHHMPELYPEPECFNPNRWLAIGVPSFEYIPFGGGSHMCIGGPFGMMETKIVLAMMLQRFRLAFVAGRRIDGSGGCSRVEDQPA